MIAPFVEGSILGVNADIVGGGSGGGSAHGGPVPTGPCQAFYLNNYPNPNAWLPRKWYPIDVSALVPAGTKAILINAILIITHGTNAETADMFVQMRAHNGPDPGTFCWQCVEPFVGGGQRQTASCWVPLDSNGVFDVWWDYTTHGVTWPSWSSYAVNGSINAYLR